MDSKELTEIATTLINLGILKKCAKTDKEDYYYSCPYKNAYISCMGCKCCSKCCECEEYLKVCPDCSGTILSCKCDY